MEGAIKMMKPVKASMFVRPGEPVPCRKEHYAEE